ncbi:hypothetical protein TNCV_1690111 [Trichonephila clavipes]|nr:hypothetical protein TNCV_1690111 [Trichonephila clavipes]
MQGHEIHHGKGLDARMSLIVALSTIQVTIQFSWFHPNPEGENPRKGPEAFKLFFPSTNLTRGLAARRLFRVPHGAKIRYIWQTSMPSPGFEPRPYNTAVSITIPDG